MKMVSSVILLLGLLALASCGQKGGTTLEVSAAFSVNAGKFDGGLIVYGESDTGKTFAMAIDDSYQKTFSLDPAKWSIYAIGWYGPGKFTGTKYCGFVKSHDNTQEPSIKITANPENCTASEFLTEVNQIKAMQFVGCNTFNKYDLSTNTWSPVLPGDPNSACLDVPLTFRPELTHFKLVAVDRLGLLNKEVFSTSCLPFDGSVSRELPLKKFSLRVKAYRSLAECNNASSKNQIYNFPHGLSQGMPSDFQHDVQTLNPTAKRILLPTSIVKVGKSPFMNLLPQIRCGTGECIPETGDPYHASVPWMGIQDEQQIISRNTQLNSCPVNLLGNSKFFNASDCEIDDGNLKAKIGTNYFTCQDSSFPILNTVDIYHKAGRIIVLKSGSPYKLQVYTSKGRFLAETNLPAGSWNSITATPNGLGLFIYLYDGNNKIYKYSYNPGSNSIIQDSFQDLSGYVATGAINDIEISGNNLIYGTLTGKLGKINYNTLGGQTELTPDGSNSINKIHLDGNIVYYLQNSRLKSKGWDSASASFVGPDLQSSVYTGLAHLATSSNSNSVYALSASNFYTFNKTNITVTPSIETHSNSMTSFALDGEHLYFANAGSLEVRETSMTPVSLTSGICTEPGLIVDGKTFSIKTKKLNDNFKLFADLWDVIGKTIAGANFSFHSLLFSEAMDSEDESGGLLRRAREHMGTKGVSAILGKQFGTCGAVKTAASSGPLNYSQFIKDPFRNEEFTINLTVSQSTTAIPSWICDATDPTGGSCDPDIDKFDLNLYYELYVAGTLHEKTRIQIDCDSASGTFESLELEGSRISRELTVWNTQDSNYARFENFDYYKDGASEQNGTITSFAKNSLETFQSRTVEVSKRSGGFSGSAMEFEKNGTDLLSKKVHVSAPDVSAFNGDSQTSETNFSAAAAAAICTPSNSTSIYSATPGTDCDFASSWSGVNYGNVATPLDLKMQDLSDIDQPTAGILQYFSLN